jgi:flagellar basal-body rod modification protein FlgD
MSNNIDNSQKWADLGLVSSDPNSKKTKSNDEVGQDQFLKLMLAQMKNQDPMKPMQNGEFLTQIAQFSSAKGIADMAKSFTTLSNSLTSNQALQASSLIGRVVLSPANQGYLEQGQGMGGSVDLTSSAQNMNVTVYDQTGAVVKTIPMGNQQSGTVYFSWDGTDNNGNQMPPGLYQVEATAGIGDTTQSLQTNIASRVESVTMGKNGQGVTLNLAGMGSIDFNNVREIM